MTTDDREADYYAGLITRMLKSGNFELQRELLETIRSKALEHRRIAQDQKILLDQVQARRGATA